MAVYSYCIGMADLEHWGERGRRPPSRRAYSKTILAANERESRPTAIVHEFNILIELPEPPSQAAIARVCVKGAGFTMAATTSPANTNPIAMVQRYARV